MLEGELNRVSAGHEGNDAIDPAGREAGVADISLGLIPTHKSECHQVQLGCRVVVSVRKEENC